MIEVEHLVKRFGAVTAVDGLTFTVRPGHVTGFLGPNGAGKTTTMRVILGLDAPTSGRATVNRQSYAELVRPLHQVGALLDAGALHPGRTAEAHLASIARSNGIGRRRVAELLRLTGLEPVAGRRLNGFSLGMKQRLGIAAALLGDPPVLMFDEPVNGLDTEGIAWIRQFLRALAADGRTILVSSHLMSEMAQTADRLIVIGRGRLIADTTTAELIQSSQRQDVLLRTPRAAEMAELLTARGATVTREDDGALAATRATCACRTGRRCPGRDRPGRVGHRRPGRLPRHRRARPDPAQRLPGGRLPGPHRRGRRLPGGQPATAGRSSRPMSATGAHVPAVSLAVRARDVIGCEWIKFRSVRSTFWTLLVAVVTPVAISVLVAFTLATAPGQGGSGLAADPLLPGLLSLEYAVLAVGVLGVLAFSTEYSTGLIRTTFAAVPRRRAVLAAKAAVIGAATLVAGEVVAFVSFALVQAVLAGHHRGVSLSRPGVPGAVLADGLLLFVVAMMGVGLGAIVRHTAGGIAALFGLIALPTVVNLLPAPWGARIGQFTLLDAARQVTALHPAANLLAPAWSLLVLLAWPAATLLAAAAVITRRDA